MALRARRSLNPTIVLFALGVASAAAYAAVVYLFPLSLASTAARAYDLEQYSRGREWAAGVYILGLLVVFGAWAAAFWAAPRVRRPLPTIAGLASCLRRSCSGSTR
jgi:lysylphosphatidylglycerol synthetase-like protein (DUF2156 family)